MESALCETADDYDVYKKQYEENGVTEEILEYIEKVETKAAIIEYWLTGAMFNRLLKINRHLLNHQLITARAMNEIFAWGDYKEALLDFCELKRLENRCYISTCPNLIKKIMNYGHEER